MIYIVNYFQAGAGRRGSSHSTNMGLATFEDKIDFDYIRKTAKEMLKRTMENNNPCINEMRTYYTIVRVENDKVTGKYVGNFKSLNIMDWKNK